MAVDPAGWPQARSRPTPRLAQSSTLYMSVRQSPKPAGVLVSPSFEPEPQLTPASNERSSHTSSPWAAGVILAHPMASVSSKCIETCLPPTVVVWVTRSAGASPGSRASQYLLQMAASVDGGACPVDEGPPVGRAEVVSGRVADRWALGGSAGSRVSQ